MAHYVLADVHGEADRFHAMLKKIQFSANDTLYILGDAIDRDLDEKSAFTRLWTYQI